MMTSVTDLGSILGVWAHPDDEAFLSGGIMAAARDAGQAVAVVTATLGEHGTPDPVAFPPHELTEVRRHELDRSLATLGVHTHRMLGYRDGGCAAVAPEHGASRIMQAIDEFEPDTVLTFGPDGYTGHPDHRAVSGWVTEAVLATNSHARVLHATAEHDFLSRFHDIHERFNVFFAGKPSVNRITDMAIHAEWGGSVLDRKVLALAAQRSQTGSLIAELGRARFREWVATESFVVPALELARSA